MPYDTTNIRVETAPADAKIDPSKIPDYAYDEGCRILCRLIRRALEDPVLRADNERYKREQQELRETKPKRGAIK